MWQVKPEFNCTAPLLVCYFFQHLHTSTCYWQRVRKFQSQFNLGGCRVLWVAAINGRQIWPNLCSPGLKLAMESHTALCLDHNALYACTTSIQMLNVISHLRFIYSRPNLIVHRISAVASRTYVGRLVCMYLWGSWLWSGWAVVSPGRSLPSGPNASFCLNHMRTWAHRSWRQSVSGIAAAACHLSSRSWRPRPTAC